MKQIAVAIKQCTASEAWNYISIILYFIYLFLLFNANKKILALEFCHLGFLTLFELFVVLNLKSPIGQRSIIEYLLIN